MLVASACHVADYWLLGCSAVQSDRSVLTFRTCLLLLSSGREGTNFFVRLYHRFPRRRVWSLTSGMLSRVVWWKYTDVSEVIYTSTIRKSSLMMRAVTKSEMSVDFYWTTLLNIPEESSSYSSYFFTALKPDSPQTHTPPRSRHRSLDLISCYQSHHRQNLIFSRIARTAHLNSHAWRTLAVISGAHFMLVVLRTLTFQVHVLQAWTRLVFVVRNMAKSWEPCRSSVQFLLSHNAPRGRLAEP
jgi:hypothetical protein